MSTGVFSATPEAIFYERYAMTRRDEVVGVLLALLLGSFGAHHFYLRRTGLGVLYLLFFWTGIPGLLGFIECFFMPARVREFNALQAASIAVSLGIPVPVWWSSNAVPTRNAPPAFTLVACPRCQAANPAGSRFCGSCGMALQ